MDRAEWLTSADPQAMLTWHQAYDVPSSTHHSHPPISDRRLRLFVCAVARLLENQDRHPERSAVIEACEQFADGLPSRFGDGLQALQGARESIDAVWGWVWACTWPNLGVALRDTLIQMRGNAGSFHRQDEVAALLREIVGDPFDENVLGVDDGWLLRFRMKEGGPLRLPFDRVCLITPQILSLAQAAYSGDWSALGPLSDALEEAGCDCEPLLTHLRGFEPALADDPRWLPPRDCFVSNEDLECVGCGAKLGGRKRCALAPPPAVKGWRRTDAPHVRGCWALDLILGKE